MMLIRGIEKHEENSLKREQNNKGKPRTERQIRTNGKQIQTCEIKKK